MRFTLATLLVVGLGTFAEAAVKTETVEYEFDGTKLKGFLAYDDAKNEKRPGVLVVHEWWGLNDYTKKRATMLAELGYVAFCVDMYGDGQVTEHPEEAQKYSGMVRKNLKTWLGRAEAGLKVLQARPEVEPKKIAAIGYCFGGTTALQLAFAGNDLVAVAAFHAGLPPITDEMTKKLKAKLFVAQGADDSFIPKEAVQKFRGVLDRNKVSYLYEEYPGATHSFTVEGIEKKMKMLKYDAAADKKSWEQMQMLFKDAFK